MEQTKNQVTISEYMKSRQYNKRLYMRLMEAIERNCSTLWQQNPFIEISISMSAKYQTPYVCVKAGWLVPEEIGRIEGRIIDAIEEVGFSWEDSEDKDTYYLINFRD